MTDGEGRIMMVRPTYKDYWDIPGGYVEPGETPYQACVREVEEELGIRPTVGCLLVADWAPTDRDGDKILFVFDGGHLTKEQHKAIEFSDGELSEYRYLELADTKALSLPRLVNRLKAALNALRTNTTMYLEHGDCVGQAPNPMERS